jgi:hypothetical protein
LSAFAADDDHWDTQFGVPGADGLVTAIACSGSDVYLTGNFTSAGEAGCIGIAKWNGANWSGFGSGFSWGSFPVGLSVAVRGAEVYVGGGFITNISGAPVRNLGRWNGFTWSEVGGGLNGYAYSLLVKGSDLYVGGIFTQAGGISASNIARWDGTTWHTLGNGLSAATNGLVASVGLSMTLDANGDLIVGGNFRYAGDVEVNNVARWDGSQWHALGSGVFNGGSSLSVNAVAALSNDVYVAGIFKSASGVNATNIARWDGAQWHAMGGGPSGTNTALAIVGTTIYTAGNFTNIGGVAARHVARWNGSAWEPLAPGTAGEILTRVSCLGTDGTNLYAGGDFIQAGNAGALAVAKWNGSQWSALTGPKSQGTWLAPAAAIADGNDVYIGGSGLRIAGGLKPNRIAHWNGSAWDDVGGGISGGNASVGVILRDAGNIYVGGNFTNAGGVAARNIAYWDGFSWHAMASGLNSNVNALCFHNGQLFAGGAFTRRGDGTVNLFGIARWNGSEWADVPTISAGRINNVINALVSDGVNLYMGGNYFIGWFETTPPFNGANVDNIGYWDGIHWWPMGNGLTNTVNELAFVGTDLYAGGSFTVSGTGTPIRRIARWNGSAWSEVGGGITNGTVNVLTASGSTLYVGGSFTGVGGITNLNRLLKWNGSQWQTLGSGVSRISPTSSSVSDIAISGDDVYVVGSFTYAGGRPSAAIGRWNETISFVPPIIQLINAGLNGSGQFRCDISGLSSGTFTIQAATALTNWSDIFSNSVPNTNFTDVNSPTIPARVYRVKTP